MKTSELTGPALDWAVAKCEGFRPCAVFGRGTVRDNGFAIPTPRGYQAALLRPSHDSWCAKCEDYPWGKNQVVWEPTKKWQQGGPIIERERIRIDCPWNPGPFEATCKIDGVTGWCKGPTILIAAMRAFVASKLGDEVEIPEELK